MRVRTLYTILIALLSLSIACSSGEGTPPAYDDDAEASSASSAPRELPPVAAYIVHPVADYDRWKQGFDDHRPAREAAGFTGHLVGRDVEDPDLVHVYLPATDEASVRAFIADPALAEVMKKAGVEGPPRIAVVKPMSEDYDPAEMLPGIVISHDVKDYNIWRLGYDQFDEARGEMGVVGDAVYQVAGKPNSVFVYHQAEDVETLRALVDSELLADVMRRAGVVGKPTIRFVQAGDHATY